MSGLATEAKSVPSRAGSPTLKGNGKRRVRDNDSQLSFEDLFWAMPETIIAVEPVYIPAIVEADQAISRNYRITDKDRLGKGNQKAKFRDNIRAIAQLIGIAFIS